MEGVELAPGFGDFWHPLYPSVPALKKGRGAAYFGGISNHHVTIHKDVRDVVVYACEDWGTHGDVRHEVAGLR